MFCTNCGKQIEKTALIKAYYDFAMALCGDSNDTLGYPCIEYMSTV